MQPTRHFRAVNPSTRAPIMTWLRGPVTEAAL